MCVLLKLVVFLVGVNVQGLEMISIWIAGASYYRVFSVFFFQAEDGIRDYKVTGVQTCALPICARYRARVRELRSVAQHQRQAALAGEAARTGGAGGLLDLHMHQLHPHASLPQGDRKSVV